MAKNQLNKWDSIATHTHTHAYVGAFYGCRPNAWHVALFVCATKPTQKPKRHSLLLFQRFFLSYFLLYFLFASFLLQFSLPVLLHGNVLVSVANKQTNRQMTSNTASAYRFWYVPQARNALATAN